MRLITFIFFCAISFSSLSQDCSFLPADTIVCGFKHNFQITEETGSFFYTCDQEKYISITEVSDQVSMFSFSECGVYEIIFESTTENCQDTFRVEVNDPSSSVTTFQTDITLGYEDIDCPDDVVADCFSDGVSISLPNGTPVPIWDFCTTVSCASTSITPDISGDIDGCLVDEITCDTLIVSDSSSECIDTNQDAFIVLNSDGDMVDNNTFLEYLAQLQAALGVNCTLAIDECFDVDAESCYDTTVMDTTYLHIPVRIGGKWTLPNIDDVELFDTTYFEFEGRSYELILDPGVEFYGQGELNVHLNEFYIVNGTDTIRNFPYGFELELLWEEDWIIDTLELIKEIPIDTTGDCFACGGNLLNSFFNVPGIPEFPCGPVGITYPDICECEFHYPDYSFQLTQCEPEKEWLFDILGGEFEVYSALGGSILGGSNTALITQANGPNITLYMVDQNGCDYEVSLQLESLVEWLEIASDNNELSCDVPSIQLSAIAFYNSDDGMMTDQLSSDPVWELDGGEFATGHTISVDEPGIYTARYIDSYGCEYLNSISITYNSTIEEYEDFAIICGNESIEYYGEIISEAGIYSIPIDCNENAILTVEKYDYSELYETYEACIGDGVFAYDQFFYGGIHTIEVPNGSPCPDRVVIEVLEIDLNPSVDVVQNCDGTAVLQISQNASNGSYEVSYEGGFLGSYTSNSNTFDFTVNDSGFYHIEVTGHGCQQSIGVDVEIIELTLAPIESSTLTCDENCVILFPEIIVIQGQSPASYSSIWTGPNGFTSTDSQISVCGGGDYTVQIEYGGGCIVQESVTIIEDFTPEVQYISADLCYGECYDDGEYTFCQSTQTTIEVDECTLVEVDITIAEEITAQESFTLCAGETIVINNTIYDGSGDFDEILISDSGCDSTLYFTVEVLEQGEIVSNNILDCVHDEALLQYISMGGEEVYVWRDEAGNDVSNSNEFIATEAGVYTLEITAIGEEKVCSFIEEFELIKEEIYPEVLLEDVYYLNCDPITDLDFEKEAGTIWTWYDDQFEVVADNTPLNTEDAGIYHLAATNIHGCTTESSIEVEQVDPLAIEYASEATCEGMGEGSIDVTIHEGGMGPFTIRVDGEIIENTMSGLEEGEHLVTVEQADGCMYEQLVQVEAIPSLEEIPDQYLEYCDGKGIKVTLNLNDELSYAWLDGYESAERQIKEEGLYEVEISNECSSIISTYHVEDNGVEENFVVSNIFSPDGNSSNDKMKVAAMVEYQDFNLYVFSRDGSLVYYTNSPEEGWDGKIKGNKVVMGAYVWMIESTIVTCLNEIERIQESGTVTVIY